jgi:ribonuclease P protein subunit POP4
MLIGRELTITESRDKSLVGVSGKILDETRNTFLVQKSNGVRITIPKAIVSIQLDGPNFERFLGVSLIGSPQERIYKY